MIRAEALFKPFLEYVFWRALVFLQCRRVIKISFQCGQPKTEQYTTRPPIHCDELSSVPLPNLNVESLSLVVTIFRDRVF